MGADGASRFYLKLAPGLNHSSVYEITNCVVVEDDSAKIVELNECRDLWRFGRWPANVVLIIFLMVLPFFIHSIVNQIYGEIEHFGVGVFLMIPLVSIINFITWLNNRIQSNKFTEIF
ncbi:uncharacterized protein LOC141664112 [Apium graveolens]|uniref:uncharacterized protein LOC141664112 n=1 Tax=Apium graveolens TaxID=4045 RepID=UPI003D7BAD35